MQALLLKMAHYVLDDSFVSGSTHKCLYLNSLFSGSVSPLPACICLSSLAQPIFPISLTKYIRTLFISLHSSKTQA